MNVANNPTPKADLPIISVITTGGTIACTTDPSGALVPTVSSEKLVASVRASLERTHARIRVRDLMCLDSSALSFADIDAIVAAVHEELADPQVTGVVVTHGTDSLEETAVALDCFHADPRPVIVTGAQKPFDAPDGDGASNLYDSVVIALDPSARDIGVLVVFGHAVIPARGVLKWHTSDELAFATNAPDEPTRPAPLPVTPLAGTNVEIIPGYPGATGRIVEDALTRGAQGLVVEAMGSGNVSPEMGAALGAALDSGIPVIISTRVPRGEVSGTYGGAGGGKTLHSKGAVGSRYMRAGQARVLLAVALATSEHPATMF